MNKVASVIGMLKADIICLQETHWSEDIMENIKKNWEEEDIFVNHGNQKACGVAILIKRERVNSIKQIYKDDKEDCWG